MSNILLEDMEFHWNLRMMLKQFYYFGRGAYTWSDEYTWKSNSVLHANLMLPHNSPSCGTKVDAAIVRGEIGLNDLFDDIEHPNASENGWDVSSCRQLITHIYHGGHGQQVTTQYPTTEWESIAQAIRNKTDVTDKMWDSVRVIHFLVKEADDKITHIIMPEEIEDFGFLFFKDRRFKEMSECLHLMYYEEGDGYDRSVRGLAWELFGTSAISDRLTNAMLDGAVLSSGLIVRGGTPDDGEKIANVMKVGPVTHIPASLDVIQQRSFAPPLTQIVDVRRQVQAIQANTSHKASTVDENFRRGLPEKSATQASLEFQDEAQFGAATAAWSYVQWEGWLTETARRLLNPKYPSTAEGYKDHVSLMERLESRGIPPDWRKFDTWERKRAERAIGLGNPNEARRLTQSLVSLSSQLPSNGRESALQDWIGIRFGFGKIGRYYPDVNPTEQMTQQAGIVQLENNDMSDGKTIMATVDDPHGLHLTWHFRFMSDFVQPFMDAGTNAPNLPQIVNGLGSLIQHVQQHILLFAQDPFRGKQALQWREPLKQFITIFNQMREALEALSALQDSAREETRRLMEDAEGIREEGEREEAMEKVRSKERIQMMNVLSLDRARDAKTASAIQNSDAKLDAEIQRIRDKTEAEVDALRKKADASTS